MSALNHSLQVEFIQKMIKTLRDHIMFPPSVLNTTARGMMGQPSFINGGSFSNFIDEASIERIAAWEKFWNRFLFSEMLALASLEYI